MHFGSLSVLLFVRLRDAWSVLEVSEKPCSPGQIQNFQQKTPQHGHLFPGILTNKYILKDTQSNKILSGFDDW